MFDPRKIVLATIIGLLAIFPTLFVVLERPYYFPGVLTYLPPALGILLVFLLLSSPTDTLERVAGVALARTPHLIFHLFFTAVFIIDLVFLVVFLLFPDSIFAGTKDTVFDVQLLGCIGTAGVLGGFIHQIHTNLRPVELKEDQTMSSYVRFWTTLFSLFSSLFISMVLFALLRAGILKTVQVDTFNVYGVTGVSAVSGYFADNIISRFTRIYREILGGERSER